MHTHLLPAASLDAQHWRRWNLLRAGLPELRGPYFEPEFVRQVAAVRPAVQVLVAADEQGIQGFLPIHRQGHTAEPIAGTFSDVEGWIARPELAIDMPRALRHCGLRRLRFRRALTGQAALGPFETLRDGNPVLDLSQGFESYLAARRRAGGRELLGALRKGRRLRRDFQGVRLELHANTPEVLGQLLTWKSQQLAGRGEYNPIREPWQFELLQRMLPLRGDFEIQLVALFVGERLAAGMYCLRSPTVLSGWLFAYSPTFQRYSPGMVLLAELAQRAPALGVDRIELGCGDERFKTGFATGTIELCEGVVASSAWGQSVQSGLLRAGHWLRSSEWTRPAVTWMRRAKAAVLRPARLAVAARPTTVARQAATTASSPGAAGN